MSAKLARLTFNFACAVLAAELVFSVGIGSLRAEGQSKDQIIRALKPTGGGAAKRGLTAPAETANTEDMRFIDDLRRRPTRSLSREDRDRITSIAQKKPSINLQINFDFGSDAIAKQAIRQVTELGEALASADLKGSTFILAGHTDAKGSDPFNQSLSERRAEAVRRYLVARYKIDPNSLVAVGYGKTQLMNSSDPLAPENRRVQIVNVAK